MFKPIRSKRVAVKRKRKPQVMAPEVPPELEKEAGIITEDSILPPGFIPHHMHLYAWKDQYMSFKKSARDAAAQRLYDAMSAKQRRELKTTGCLTIKCAAGHTVKTTPLYAGTTSAGCFSLTDNEGDYDYHAPTTIGDFLLTLKLQFAVQCYCRGRRNIALGNY